jgi:DNA-binding MarR family transcriptional regulator
MAQTEPQLQSTVNEVINTLPPVWDRIRSNLRAAAIENFGITLEQFHILRHIRKGYDSVAKLAEQKGISRPAASQAVTVLVKKGLVTRTTQPEDRRAIQLTLTPYAREVMDANFEKNRLWMSEKMQALTPEQLQAISAAMLLLKDTFTPQK